LILHSLIICVYSAKLLKDQERPRAATAVGAGAGAGAAVGAGAGAGAAVGAGAGAGASTAVDEDFAQVALCSPFSDLISRLYKLVSI